MYTRSALSLAVCLFLGACGGSSEDDDGNGQSIDFEAFTAPLAIDSELATVFDASGDVVIYGNDGRYASFDGGVTWRDTAVATFGAHEGVRVVEGALMRPSDSGFLRMGQADGSWQTVTAAPPGPIRQTAWAVHPSDGAYFVANRDVDSIYGYVNGSWETFDLGSVAPNDLTETYHLHIDSNGTLYAGTQHGLYVSTTDGATWDWRLQNAYIEDMTVTDTLVVIRNTGLGGVRRSDDGGQTHEALPLPNGETSFPRAAPDGRLIAGAYVSDDAGATWTQLFDSESYGLGAQTGDRLRISPDAIYLDNGSLLRTTNPPGALRYVGGTRHLMTAQNVLSAFSETLLPEDGEHGFVMEAYQGSRSRLARYDSVSGQWELLPFVDGATSHRASISKLRDGRLAVMRPDVLYLRSTSGQWSEPVSIWPSAPLGYEPDLAWGLFETDDGTLYASSQWSFCNTQAECVYISALARSDDDGASFTPVYEQGERVFAAVGTTLYTAFKRSSDGGLSWQDSPAAIPILDLGQGELLFMDENNSPHTLRVLSAGGSTRTLGDLTVQSYLYEAPLGGNPGALSGIDGAGHLYALCGSPYLQICRSTQPVVNR